MFAMKSVPVTFITSEILKVIMKNKTQNNVFYVYLFAICGEFIYILCSLSTYYFVDLFRVFFSLRYGMNKVEFLKKACVQFKFIYMSIENMVLVF